MYRVHTVFTHPLFLLQFIEYYTVFTRQRHEKKDNASVQKKEKKCKEKHESQSKKLNEKNKARKQESKPKLNAKKENNHAAYGNLSLYLFNYIPGPGCSKHR